VRACTNICLETWVEKTIRARFEYEHSIKYINYI